MKKYLLAVLALGAMTLVACNPDNNEGNGGNNDPVADYEVTTASVYQATLDWGGDYYGEGTDNGVIMLVTLDDPTMVNVTKMSAVYLDYVLEPKEVFDGCGTFGPGIDANAAWEQTPAVNTYVVGVYDEVEDAVYGSAYMELDYTVYAYTVNEPVVAGEFTVAQNADGTYNVTGLLTLGNGKTVNLDYQGALGSMIGPMSRAALTPKSAAKAFSSVWKK